MGNTRNYPAEPVRLHCDHNFPEYVNTLTQMFHSEGHDIYLVGGSVRDLLLGADPDDHDFTVSANADEIVRICRKYGLEYDDQYAFLDYIIVHFGDDKIDITKFKGDTLRNDVLGRDLTINALAYDAESHEIIDYVGGIEDMKSGIIRLTDPDLLTHRPDICLRALRFSLSEFNTEEEMDQVILKLKEAVEGFRKLGSFR